MVMASFAIDRRTWNRKLVSFRDAKSWQEFHKFLCVFLKSISFKRNYKYCKITLSAESLGNPITNLRNKAFFLKFYFSLNIFLILNKSKRFCKKKKSIILVCRNKQIVIFLCWSSDVINKIVLYPKVILAWWFR